jgi:hypothetical protein
MEWGYMRKLLTLLLLPTLVYAADPIVTESTVTSNNTNNNINTSTSTVTSDNTNRNYNTNVNESTNINKNTSVNTSTNTNYDTSNITSKSDTNSVVTTNGSQTTKLKSPPPSAIAPQFSSGHGNDLCTVGASGAVQTQILGMSFGTTFTEENCIRLKNAKTLYDMGMKVAAVSIMCQDKQVFDGMMAAGTPCPIDGKIGQEAKEAWKVKQETEEVKANAEQKRNQALGIIGTIFGSALLF